VSSKFRFSMRDLDDAQPLARIDEIATLERCWGWDASGNHPYKGVNWRQAWANLVLLGRRFLAATGDDGAGGAEWHHLVMAVGNFKRQTPIEAGVALAPEPTPQRRSFCIPGTDHLIAATQADDPLHRSEPDVWRALSDVRGVEVATATALLAALWPTDHFVCDKRVRRTTVALSCGAAWRSDSALAHSGIPRTQDWELYSWLWACLVESLTDEAELVTLEQGLFILDGRTMRKIPDSAKWEWTWSEYVDTAHAVLDAAGATAPAIG
jgi:hypothetical protein